MQKCVIQFRFIMLSITPNRSPTTSEQEEIQQQRRYYNARILEGNEELRWYKKFLDNIQKNISALCKPEYFEDSTPDHIKALLATVTLNLNVLDSNYKNGLFPYILIIEFCRQILKILVILGTCILYMKPKNQKTNRRRWDKLLSTHYQGMEKMYMYPNTIYKYM